jgi:16S rRNA (cytosine967-C5)-methyltransferase
VMDNAVAFQENIDVESFAILNKEVVVQDYSSQQIATLLQLIPTTNYRKKVWDCCAASGGKSILAADVLGKIDLFVSDVRESILHNLKKRLAVAQIAIQNCEVNDLTKPQRKTNLFDVIIADVPCTGSGTWGRTPENLVYFKQVEIINFQQLQQIIISNTVPSLKTNGYYLLITCSVFAKENEENVQFIQQKFGLQLVQQKYFEGFDKRADTLFGALFIKS